MLNAEPLRRFPDTSLQRPVAVLERGAPAPVEGRGNIPAETALANQKKMSEATGFVFNHPQNAFLRDPKYQNTAEAIAVESEFQNAPQERITAELNRRNELKRVHEIVKGRDQTFATCREYIQQAIENHKRKNHGMCSRAEADAIAANIKKFFFKDDDDNPYLVIDRKPTQEILPYDATPPFIAKELRMIAASDDGDYSTRARELITELNIPPEMNHGAESSTSSMIDQAKVMLKKALEQTDGPFETQYLTEAEMNAKAAELIKGEGITPDQPDYQKSLGEKVAYLKGNQDNNLRIQAEANMVLHHPTLTTGSADYETALNKEISELENKERATAENRSALKEIVVSMNQKGIYKKHVTVPEEMDLDQNGLQLTIDSLIRLGKEGMGLAQQLTEARRITVDGKSMTRNQYVNYKIQQDGKNTQSDIEAHVKEFNAKATLPKDETTPTQNAAGKSQAPEETRGKESLKKGSSEHYLEMQKAAAAHALKFLEGYIGSKDHKVAEMARSHYLNLFFAQEGPVYNLDETGIAVNPYQMDALLDFRRQFLDTPIQGEKLAGAFGQYNLLNEAIMAAEQPETFQAYINLANKGVVPGVESYRTALTAEIDIINRTLDQEAHQYALEHSKGKNDSDEGYRMARNAYRAKAREKFSYLNPVRAKAAELFARENLKFEDFQALFQPGNASDAASAAIKYLKTQDINFLKECRALDDTGIFKNFMKDKELRNKLCSILQEIMFGNASKMDAFQKEHAPELQALLARKQNMLTFVGKQLLLIIAFSQLSGGLSFLNFGVEAAPQGDPGGYQGH